MQVQQGTTTRGAWLPAIVAVAAGLMWWRGAPPGVTLVGCLAVVDAWMCWTHRSDLWALEPYARIGRGRR